MRHRLWRETKCGVEPLCRDLKNKKFSKQTQERQETQETHMAIFCMPLFSFALRKGKNRNEKLEKITQTQETQETQETHTTPVVILFSFPVRRCEP